ncbi:MAG: archaemetzincin family Zn-dependent metalloprotease [Gammaproteobacteria bacterium]
MDLELSILPFKGTDPQDLEALAGALSTLFNRVTLLKPSPVPQAAFNTQRGQYRANELLEVARRRKTSRVLAVTSLDLYAGNLNFVFGLADLPGKAAVISFYRLHFGADDGVFRARALKEAVHELGHTFGLRHCGHPRCVMGFSSSLSDTDRKSTRFCRNCVRKLAGQAGIGAAGNS